MSHIAAIDIGSNATRLLIKDTEGMEQFYVPEIRDGRDFYQRTSLKIGFDVYQTGLISSQNIVLLLQTLLNYKGWIEKYGCDAYRVCATASFRDAKNGNDVARCLSEESGLKVEIISGEEETSLSRLSYFSMPESAKGMVLFADVGGGSTDISLCNNKELIFSKSYSVGSMRMVSGNQSEEMVQEMVATLRSFSLQYDKIHFVGSGGSIHLISQMFARYQGDEIVSVQKMREFYDAISPLSLEQKILKYSFRVDRAEIIVEATSIFLQIAEACQISEIQAPRIGVRDGLIMMLLSALKIAK